MEFIGYQTVEVQERRELRKSAIFPGGGSVILTVERLVVR
jgi:hypothetical protein